MILKRLICFAALPLSAVTVALFLAAPVSAATVYGGTTTVALNTTTVSGLQGLGFAIAPVAPSTLGGTPLSATFPIIGGDNTTMIDHSGGLAFTEGGTTADIENFVINLTGTNAGTITGLVLVNGATVSTSTELFDIGAGLALTLDSALAADLTAVFGAPNLTGASIGTATIAAVTTPEPTTLAIAGLGLLATGLLAKRRSRKS